MEHFEREALQAASNPPQFWFRFVDDTWVIQQSIHIHEFLDHINSIDPTIKFTVEGTQGNGGVPFFDSLVTPEADNYLSFTVYCKPTHTDQYLQWDSHHNLSTKYSVIGTLTHRAKTVCTKPELLQKELSHLREALVKYKYPPWAINRVQSKLWSPRTKTPRTTEVARHHLQGGVHRRDIKVPVGEAQGTSQGTITHPCTHPVHRAQCYIWQLQHNRKGEQGPGQDNKGGYLH